MHRDLSQLELGCSAVRRRLEVFLHATSLVTITPAKKNSGEANPTRWQCNSLCSGYRKMGQLAFTAGGEGRERYVA